tara:strand:+ start:155 stop:268 length:114 start_codon:yes stop_codon:yes gene_type:complete
VEAPVEAVSHVLNLISVELPEEAELAYRFQNAAEPAS